MENLKGSQLVTALEPSLSLFGTTKRLITDKGTNFSSKETKALLKRMDIEIHYIATGASRANGQAERYIATVLNLLACEVARGSEWSRVLWKIQLRLNTTVQKSIGCTPIELLTGIRSEMPALRRINSELPELESSIDVHQLRVTAEKRLRNNALKTKQRFDKMRRNNIQLKEGDIVYVQQQRTRLSKLDPRYNGPFTIEKCLPKDR